MGNTLTRTDALIAELMAGGSWMNQTVHVVPLDDLKPHVEVGQWCHCKPRVQPEGEGVLVIHNAYDGREFYEDEQVEANP